MKDKFQITHEFLVLFLNLAQLKDQNQIIELFVNAINQGDIGVEFEYQAHDNCLESECILIETLENNFGGFKTKGKLKKIDADLVVVIRNLINMLAVILENIKRERLLEQKASKTETELKTLMDNTGGMIYRCKNDANWTMLYISGGVEAITGGYTADDFISQKISFSDIVFLEDNKRVGREVNEAVAKKEDFILEYRITKKNGQVCWVHEQGRGVFNKDGSGDYLEGLMMDITEQKKAEEALTQSEEEFRSLYETTVVGLFRTRMSDGRFLKANLALAELLGFKSVGELYEDPDALKFYRYPEKRKKFVHELKDKGSVSSFEITIVRQDGVEKIISVSAKIYPQRDYIEGIVIDITARKQTEEELKNLSTRLELAVDSANMGVWENDIINNKLIFDQKMLDIYGLKESQFDNTFASWIKMVHPDDRARLAEEGNKAVLSDKRTEQEFRIVRLDGEIRHILAAAVSVKNDNGETVGSVGINLDITERKVAAKKVAESAKEYRSTVDGLLVGVIVHDVNGNLLLSNPEASRILGLTVDQMAGKKLIDPEWKFVSEDLSTLKVEDYPASKVISTNKPLINYVLGIARPEREYITWVNVNAMPISSADGKLGKIIVNFMDITERKKAEESLKKSEQRSRAWLEYSPVCTKIVDLDFNLQYMSQAGIKALEVDDITPFYGKPYPFYFYPESFKNIMTKNLEKVRDNGGVIKHEAAVVDIHGQEVWFHSTLVPVYDDEGKIEYIIIVSLDTTERKKAEAEIASLAKFPEENPSPVMRLLNNGEVVYANEGAKEFLDLWNCKSGKCEDREILDTLNDAFADRQIKTIEAKAYDKIFSMKFTPVENTEYINIYGLDITERKMLEQALEKRIVAMTQPLDEAGSVDFDVLFNIKEIQKLQDLFAKSANVASVITDPNGIPITKASNFCRLCSQIIRKTEKGLNNCHCSDAEIGRHNPKGPIIQPCLSGGLWDAGASISVGGKHIANWLIGQVRNEAQNEEKMEEYAHEIGADPKEFIKAFREVPKMSKEQFENVANALFVMANLLSASAYQNIQQARFIDERKKAEAGLLVSNERFQELFDNMSSGVAIYNAVDNGNDFIFKDFNKSGEKIENISKLDIIGKRVTEVFPGIKEFGLLDVFKRVFQTGEPEKFPSKIYKDERIIGWRENYIYKLPAGELIAIYDDVTEQKKSEEQEKEIFAAKAAAQVEKAKARELFLAYEELKRTQHQLLQVEKLASIGQLGAGVAHELNSPLAGILSLLRSYKKEKDRTTEEYEDLQEMEKACEHMAAIIKGLNTFARQSTGELKEVNCNEAIKSALSFTIYQFEKKGVNIETNLDDGLDKVKANENQIQQIVINMLTNAMDALPQKGTFKITTKNTIVDGNKYGEITFEDNGMGIKKDDLKKVFDPFFTTKRPRGGVGLGLSIVYRIVENHKGTIAVESQEGKGTVFTVRLPSR